VRDTTRGGGYISISIYISDFQGSQAVPACPGIDGAYNRIIFILYIFMPLEEVYDSNLFLLTLGGQY
jgi:hypothetical protein